MDILRRYAAEFIGTFALVFFGCGTRIMVGDTNNPAGILVVHLAFGLTVAAMIYTLSYLSSAHFNPAITFGFAISRRFPWRHTIPYWLAQFAGAICASGIHGILFPDKAPLVHYGAPALKIAFLPAIILEALLTFILMLVSMASATDKRFNRADSGMTVGFTIVVSGLFANSLTGGSMNPARSLGPALLAGGTSLATIWVYFVGPLCGALLGAVVYEIIRGSEKYAKDVLEEFPTSKSFNKEEPQQQ
jgi:MIP family channel proteins